MLKIFYYNVLLLILYIRVYCNRNSDYKNDNLCLVSKLIDTQTTGTVSYPIDMFNNSNDKTKYDHLYHCISCEVNNTMHLCPSSTKIFPLDEIDLMSSINKMNQYDYKHSICHSKNSNYHKRIIIFGGSVTAGINSYGCHCFQSTDRKCPIKKSFDELTTCRWSNHLYNWYKTLYSNSQMIVITIGGAPSPLMAEMLENKLIENNITSFTSNDIIFIDHSVNDGSSYGSSLHTKDGIKELENGLENFIRKIYYYSQLSNWPTIILLEMWPYHNFYLSNKNRPDSIKHKTIFDYSNVYNKIATNYQLMLFSYRDLIWSNNFELKYINNTNTLSLLRFQRNTDHIHPPWMIHLLYADLISSLLYQQIRTCRDHHNKHFLSTNKMNYSQLIAPVSTDRISECSNDGINLLDLNSMSFVNTSLVRNIGIGRYTTSSINSWIVYEDKPGKSGWIDEISVSNDQSFNYNENLTFHFINNNNALYQLSSILHVLYFRTYFNGGIVNIYLCNQYLTSLDTLWTEVHYHTSTTRLYTYKFDANNSNRYCYNQDNGTITFNHIYVDENHFKLRNKQKFKLVSIKICTPLVS